MKEVISISKRLLLLPYLPSFIFLVIALSDVLFFEKHLLSYLPTTSKDLFLYYILFEFPHIIASFFMFCEKEYRAVYKDILYKKLIAIFILGILLLLVSQSTFYVIMIGYTLYHVVKQQFGIAKFYGPAESSLLTILLTLFVGVGSLAFISTALPVEANIIHAAATLGMLGVFAFFIFGKEEKKNVYLTFFMLSFGSSALLFGLGYTLLGLLSMRIVHDITAFIFYGVHNHNRKKDGNNPLFSLPLLRLLSPLVLTILFAFIFNLFYMVIARSVVDIPTASFILIGFYYMTSIMHYFIEGRIWKKGSLARNYIQVA